MPTPKERILTSVLATSLVAPLFAIGLPALAEGDDDRDRLQREIQISPKVVLISLDGAKPDLIQKYLEIGVLPRNSGLGKLSQGVVARQNVTTTPSLTA